MDWLGLWRLELLVEEAEDSFLEKGIMSGLAFLRADACLELTGIFLCSEQLNFMNLPCSF